MELSVWYLWYALALELTFALLSLLCWDTAKELEKCDLADRIFSSMWCRGFFATQMYTGKATLRTNNTDANN